MRATKLFSRQEAGAADAPGAIAFACDWTNQRLPAPLIPYELAESVAVGLLRRTPAGRAAVGAGVERVCAVLAGAGVACTELVLDSPGLLVPNLVLETDADGAARFDVLTAEVLSAPLTAEPETCTWWRQRRLAHLRHLALSEASAVIRLPELDRFWATASPTSGPAPRPARWIAQASPALAIGAGALLTYIYNAGRAPALWPLLVLPLLGAWVFSGLVYTSIRRHRLAVAAEYLARPARSRPDAARVATALATRPWGLLAFASAWVLTGFASVVLALASALHPSLGTMLWPAAGAYLGLVLGVWALCRRYLRQTRAAVEQLPVGLLPPIDDAQTWRFGSYY